VDGRWTQSSVAMIFFSSFFFETETEDERGSIMGRESSSDAHRHSFFPKR
jgi:hypothetical protein